LPLLAAAPFGDFTYGVGTVEGDGPRVRKPARSDDEPGCCGIKRARPAMLLAA
jgi:hypothetical protein